MVRVRLRAYPNAAKMRDLGVSVRTLFAAVSELAVRANLGIRNERDWTF